MSTRYTSPSRRAFLKLLASAGSASVFAPLLKPGLAEAQTATPPLRYLGLLTHHGRVFNSWSPQGSGESFNIDFPDSTLRPLQPYRSKLLVLDGLDYRTLIDHQRTGHSGGPATCFTGSRYLGTGSGADPGGTTTGPSMDVWLGSRIAGTAALRSIQISNHANFCTDVTTLSFSQTGQQLPNLYIPLDIYNRLFNGFTPGGTTVDPAQVKREGLVQFWLKDANRLRAKLAGPEQRKLDAHLDGLRDIERRLQPSGAGAMCSLPTRPRTYSANEVSGCGGLQGERLIPERTKLIFDMIAHAFACDRVRFVAMHMSAGAAAAFGTYLANPSTQNVHDNLAHDIDNPASAAALNRLQTWEAEQVAYLLGKLGTFDEQGGTLLDHSLVLWGNELSDPAAHSNDNMAYVIAGGCNGAFRLGRSIRYAAGTPHNRVLTSVARAFGQNVDSFGDPAYVGEAAGLV
jgi:hypothetical protein